MKKILTVVCLLVVAIIFNLGISKTEAQTFICPVGYVCTPITIATTTNPVATSTNPITSTTPIVEYIDSGASVYNQYYGSFYIKYKVTAIGGDIYIPSYMNQQPQQLHFVDIGGVIMPTASSTNISHYLKNVTDFKFSNNGNYRIREGETHIFTLSVGVNSLMSGQYRLTIPGIHYDVVDTRNIRSVAYVDKTKFRTAYYYLSAETPQPPLVATSSITVISPNGGEVWGMERKDQTIKYTSKNLVDKPISTTIEKFPVEYTSTGVKKSYFPLNTTKISRTGAGEYSVSLSDLSSNFSKAPITPGNYRVCLTTQMGVSDCSDNYFTIGGKKLSADLFGIEIKGGSVKNSKEIAVGSNIGLIAMYNGTLGQGIARYTWEVNGVKIEKGESNGDQSYVSYRFDKVGTYSIGLNVFDVNNQVIATKSVKVKVVDSINVKDSTSQMRLQGATTSVAPRITSVLPLSAKAGDTVTLYGTNFTGVIGDLISISNSNGSISPEMIYSSSPSSVVFKMPNVPAGTYYVDLTANSGTSNRVTINVLASVVPAAGQTIQTTEPYISNISPTSGKFGDTVTIRGLNFEGVVSDLLFMDSATGSMNPDIVLSNATTVVFKVPNVPTGVYSIYLAADKGISNKANFTVQSEVSNTSNTRQSATVFEWFMSLFK